MIEVSIIQVNRHYEIMVWNGREPLTESEWVWGWNNAKERAFEIAKQYENARVVRPELGKRVEVKS